MPNHTQTIDPISMAFQTYLISLHEKYPGILAQFAVEQDRALQNRKHPGKHRDKKGVICPYSLDGRLFFPDLRITTPYLPKKSAHQTTLTDTIQIALDETKQALETDQPLSDTLAHFNDIKIATLQSSLAYLKSRSDNDRPSQLPDLFSEVFNEHSPIFDELAGLLNNSAANDAPQYTLELIEFILKIRHNITQAILGPNARDLINGFLSKGYEDQNACLLPDISDLAYATISGAILYRLIAAALIQKKIALSPAFNKLISGVINSSSNDPLQIRKNLLLDFKIANIDTQFDPDKEISERMINLQTIHNHLLQHTNDTSILPLPYLKDFVAFQPDSFALLLQKLNHYLEKEEYDEKNKLQMELHELILNFLESHVEYIKDDLKSLKIAVNILNKISFRKPHIHKDTLNPRQQQCLLSYQAMMTTLFQRKKEIKKTKSELKAFAEAIEPRINTLVKKVSEKQYKPIERKESHKLEPQHRTQSTLSLFSPRSSLDRLKRGMSQLGLHQLPTETSTENQEKKHRFSPPHRRKRRPRHSEGSDSPSPTLFRKNAGNNSPSPDLRHRKQKIRKQMEPDELISPQQERLNRRLEEIQRLEESGSRLTTSLPL